MADLPDTIVDLPVTMVDLPKTMVDLPNTMMDLPNTIVDLHNTIVFSFSFCFSVSSCFFSCYFLFLPVSSHFPHLFPFILKILHQEFGTDCLGLVFFYYFFFILLKEAIPRRRKKLEWDSWECLMNLYLSCQTWAEGLVSEFLA